MPAALPFDSAIRILIEKFELVTGDQANVILLGEHEIGHPLFVLVVVKADSDVALSLRFLKALVIVSFELDQWIKHVLVLSRVLIPEQYWLHHFLLDLFLSIQVGDLGLGLQLPEFF